MASTITKEIVTEIPTLARVYNDGTVERFKKIQIVPLNDDGQKTGPAVSSKDIIISENPFVAARLYIQHKKQRAAGDERIPILVYFHGGGFITESAFSPVYHAHFNEFVSLVDVMVVSVEYRIAPEHHLPAAYHDCWTALNWVTSHNSSIPSGRNSDIDGHNKAIQISTYNEICCIYETPSYFKNLENSSNSTEPWLINYGDFDKVFVGGDSAGGNMAHHVAMRASSEALLGGVKITGAICSHPFFYGSDLDPAESLPETWKGKNHYVSAWNWAYPTAPGGIDNPMINPVGPGAPSLAGLVCEKMLVCVAGKDKLRDRGVRYYEGVKKSGWKGNLELFEEEEEGHGYHIHKPQTENSHKMIKRLGEFLLG